ncbi:MAG: serine/threonine protein kinase [Planctomycetota bacterium]|jgi:hypothetical protein
MAATPEDRLDRILSDWFRRKERQDPEELIRKHPDVADELRERFDALRVFEPDSEGVSLPERIGKYRIVSELGRGAMGIVYEAEQVDLERTVALKVLSPVIASDAAAVARFYREAQAAARLEHRNIAAVHEFGRDHAYTYFSMELVEGQSLHDWILDRRTKGPGTAPGKETCVWLARLFADVATGLQVAHEMEVIHRDIKPSNILIASDGTPKVVDFGLARVGGTTQTLTTPGEVLGTLHYMSPEQAGAMREEIDARTDVYSLGASLYEALTLQPPFEGEDPIQLITRILNEEPPRPRRVLPGIPKDLETITLRAMAKERDQRYASTVEFAADLERFLRDERIEARRPGPLMRTRGWMRRHPSRTAAAASAIVAVVLAAVLLLLALAPEKLPETHEGMAVHAFAPGARSELEAAGIDADATILDWTGFLLPGRGMGTAVAAGTSRPNLQKVDVLAFGAGRQLLWSASTVWPDYRTTLGWGAATIDDLRCLVTRGRGADAEESLIVSGGHHSVKALFLVDPVTGEQRGVFRPPAGFTPAPEYFTMMGIVPDWSERPRRLILPGQHETKEGEIRPSLIVTESSGKWVRRYVLPFLGVKADRDVWPLELTYDWSPDHPELLIRTNEDLLISMLVKERLLDIDSVRVAISDTVEIWYDRAHGEGALEALIEEKGGYESFVHGLGEQVKVVED